MVWCHVLEITLRMEDMIRNREDETCFVRTLKITKELFLRSLHSS